MPKSTALLLSTTIMASVLLAACTPSSPASETSQTQPSEPTTAPTTENTGEMTKGKQVSVDAPYESPAGEESIGITLSVDENGVITDAKAEVKATEEKSIVRQQAFADGLPTAVKGKKLSELTKIDKVGGSSLTTQAFNEALVKLKAQL